MLEPNYYGLWVGKQTAKGTPNTTPGKRLVQVGGDLAFNRADGSEPYSDLTKYGQRTDWVDSLLGQGDPAIEATPTELAYLLWLFHGAEAVTSITGPPTAQNHKFTPQNTKGFYFTAFRRVGSSVVSRVRYDDCLITKFVLEGSTANKALRITPSILSLDPGAVFTSDPSAALPTDKSLLYTDAVGAFTIDGTVYKGQTSFNLTVDDAWTAVFGDDNVPFDVVQGTPVVSLAVKLYFDSAQLSRWNLQAYGSATPSAGDKPLKVIPAFGSYATTFTQKDSAGAVNGRLATVTVPQVKWDLPPAPAPNPAGGLTEVDLTGTMRPTVGGSPAPYTIDVQTANAVTAFTA